MQGIAGSCLALSVVIAVLVGVATPAQGAEEKPGTNVVCVSWEGTGEIESAPPERGGVLGTLAAMRLSGNVRVEGRQFMLETDRLMYSAPKEVLILESHGDNAVRPSLSPPDDRGAIRLLSRKIMLSISGKRLAVDDAGSVIVEGKPQGEGPQKEALNRSGGEKEIRDASEGLDHSPSVDFRRRMWW